MCIKTLSASTCKGLFSSDILIGLITNKTSNIRILNFTFEFQKVTGNTKGYAWGTDRAVTCIMFTLRNCPNDS